MGSRRSGGNGGAAGRPGFRSVVVGIDGSPHARRALEFVMRLPPPSGGRATVVTVVEPMRAPSTPLMPASVRASLVGEVATLNASQRRVAQRLVDEAANRLEKQGWRAHGEVRIGVPAPELLRAAKAARADLLVVGARGAGAMKRALLGSVADAVLKQSSTAVLIAR